MSIAIQAVFQGARTTADGGWRISFDCSEQMAQEVTEIAALRNDVVYVVVLSEKEYNDHRGSVK
jgi:hypothetical protein